MLETNAIVDWMCPLHVYPGILSQETSQWKFVLGVCKFPKVSSYIGFYQNMFLKS